MNKFENILKEDLTTRIPKVGELCLNQNDEIDVIIGRRYNQELEMVQIKTSTCDFIGDGFITRLEVLPGAEFEFNGKKYTN
jgi:hypothetical protein